MKKQTKDNYVTSMKLKKNVINERYGTHLWYITHCFIEKTFNYFQFLVRLSHT